VWPLQSTPPGLILMTSRDGDDLLNARRSSSALPLIPPKKGVKTPGVAVAPSPW